MDKIKIIKEDTVVNIEVSASFMLRIQSLLIKLIMDYGNDKFLQFYKNLIENEKGPQNQEEEHIHALLLLTIEFEKIAEKENKVVEKDGSIADLIQGNLQAQSKSE